MCRVNATGVAGGGPQVSSPRITLGQHLLDGRPRTAVPGQPAAVPARRLTNRNCFRDCKLPLRPSPEPAAGADPRPWTRPVGMPDAHQSPVI